MSFICVKCHPHCGCWDQTWPVLHSRSVGRCEDCGETRECYDCHGYTQDGDYRVWEGLKP